MEDYQQKLERVIARLVHHYAYGYCSYGTFRQRFFRLYHSGDMECHWINHIAHRFWDYGAYVEYSGKADLQTHADYMQALCEGISVFVCDRGSEVWHEQNGIRWTVKTGSAAKTIYGGLVLHA